MVKYISKGEKIEKILLKSSCSYIIIVKESQTHAEVM